jgi:hypothetical protein
MVELEKMDPEILAGGIVFLAGLFAAMVAYNVIRYLMKGIGYGTMYRKAGVAPWKAFIPVYNIYNNYKLAWAGKFFFLFAALYILLNTLMGVEALALQMVAAAAGIALLVVDMKQNIKMAKLFGKGNGTGVALFFFPGITSLILGLGKAEFQGEMIENN